MIDRIGFVPSPPLLIPEVASGAAVELNALRSACDEMLTELLRDRDHLVVVLPRGAEQLGEWLVQRSGWSGSVDVIAVTETSLDATASVAEVLRTQGSSAVLVLGDGSACRTLKAPGYLDERAAPFDDMLAEWLSDANATALAGLDQQLAAELLVAGRTVWPPVARLVESDGRDWVGELTYRDDPYGVSYFVALWKPSS